MVYKSERLWDVNAAKLHGRQTHKPPLRVISGEVLATATVKEVDRLTTTPASGNICNENEVKEDERRSID